jgi:hypothetical protein
MTDSIGGHELALTIINDGAGYARRCSLARQATAKEHGRGAMAQLNAIAWVSVATDGARAYERQFGSYGASCFTAQDILAAAIELADYYAQHVAEMD